MRLVFTFLAIVVVALVIFREAMAADLATTLPPFRGTRTAARSLSSPLSQTSVVVQNSAKPTASQIFALPSEDGTMVGLSSNQAKMDNSVSSLDMDASITYGLSQEWFAGATLGYRSVDYGGSWGSEKGMKDIELHLIRAEAYELLTAVYGIDFGFSPTDRIQAGQNTAGNSFSGGYSVRPYWGAEHIIRGGGVVGGQVNSEYSFGRTTQELPKGFLGSYGFFEFPLTSKAQLGILAGLNRQITPPENSQIQNSYRLRAYGGFKALEFTHLEMQLEAVTLDSAVPLTTTSIGIGLRHWL